MGQSCAKLIFEVKMKKYYVYEWYNEENNYIFYVGKGCRNRYKAIRGRNKEFLKYIDNNKCNCRIIKGGLSEEEAFSLEKEIISKYKKEGLCCCNFDNGGLTFDKGNKNSQFGISPSERMSREVYNEWRRKQYIRKFGCTNPNYHNDTLHKKYLKDPLLALEKQSRPGVQNGRSLPIKMYDKDYNLVKEFPYIRDCCKYLIKNNYTKSQKINVIYSGIWNANKHNKQYLGFHFKY